MKTLVELQANSPLVGSSCLYLVIFNGLIGYESLIVRCDLDGIASIAERNAVVDEAGARNYCRQIKPGKRSEHRHRRERWECCIQWRVENAVFVSGELLLFRFQQQAAGAIVQNDCTPRNSS